MNELSEQLINQAITGDTLAFKSIVLHYSSLINRLAFRYTACTDAADDITQDTFIKAFRAIGKYQKAAKFSTWLARIATNTSIDYLRKHRYQQHTDSFEQTEYEYETTELAADNKLDLNRQLQGALHELTEKERLAFTMKHYQGFSIDETAAALEINSNACKQTIYRAVQKLRKQLAPMVSA